jgi:hypothetical protein
MSVRKHNLWKWVFTSEYGSSTSLATSKSNKLYVKEDRLHLRNVIKTTLFKYRVIKQYKRCDV